MIIADIDLVPQLQKVPTPQYPVLMKTMFIALSEGWYCFFALHIFVKKKKKLRALETHEKLPSNAMCPTAISVFLIGQLVQFLKKTLLHLSSVVHCRHHMEILL